MSTFARQLERGERAEAALDRVAVVRMPCTGRGVRYHHARRPLIAR